MVLLYTVLGAAMMTGIFAMFEVGFGIVNQQASLQSPPDPYLLSRTPDYGGYDIRRLDRELLSILTGYSNSWNADMCASVKNAASPSVAPEFNARLTSYVKDLPPPALIDRAGGCALTSGLTTPASSQRHRVLLFPPAAGGTDAVLFSCLLEEGQTVCSIENG